MLVFSVDIGLVIICWKVLKKCDGSFIHFLTQKHFAKKLHLNNISNVHHIGTIEHFLTSEEDKQLYTQIPCYCLIKMLQSVPQLLMALMYHFYHIQYY